MAEELVERATHGTGTPVAAGILIAVTLLAAGCGSGVSQTTARTAGTHGGKVLRTHCTAVSGGFRACTVFRKRGEAASRIERRHGSRRSVLLGPDRAPNARSRFPHISYWRRVLAAPGGGFVLAEWEAECEVPFTYLITTRKPALRQVFRPNPASALGWTSEGLARVRLWKPISAAKTRIGRSSGIYLVTARGRVVRRERRMPAARGC